MPEDKKEQESLDPTKIAAEEEKDFKTGNPVDDNEKNVDEIETKTPKNQEENNSWEPFVPEKKPNESDWKSPEGKELINTNEADKIVEGDKYAKPDINESYKPEGLVNPSENLTPESKEDNNENVDDPILEMMNDITRHWKKIHESVEVDRRQIKKHEEYINENEKLIKSLQQQVDDTKNELLEIKSSKDSKEELLSKIEEEMNKIEGLLSNAKKETKEFINK